MSARFEVDLARFAADLRRIRAVVAPAQHLLVVKDDAYGHGLAQVVARAVHEGVAWFGTFDVATALAVRGVSGPGPRIVAWTVYDDAEIDTALDAGIDLGLGTHELIVRAGRRARARGARARVHLKIDTGLHRNGIRPEEWPAAVDSALDAQRAGVLEVAGVWSHIAEASDAEDDAARAAFLRGLEQFDPARTGAPAPLRHLAASAAAFARPEFRFDLVRIGAFAYGIRPAGGPLDAALGIAPIGTLYGTVTRVEAEAVVLDLGALDGLDSRLAGLVPVGTPAGERELVEVGDTFSRVAAWPGARVGDDVAVLGGRAPLSATDVAERLDTIGEEVVLRVSPRLPRTYLG
ncbi:alanine racemase [Microbacterium sp.]|uniref:alanine racemase n=1 Tax=Microbacterium sp. TaxID=51671 RepID=UPI003A93BF98